ncbi:unnamed protein product [Paramecium pentaurelia]|uniref:Cyclic nucleotide-binding domain-containing protein n=1 Tax=Paramecium pentaurelia TaxID=43138 RepID=A0A8S1T7Y0_9CILI|nr:unnamed protein product [Paramecium pentaurelia]
MISGLQKIRFRKEEQEKMEDQEIELEALNKVDKELEMLDNSSVWKSKPLRIIQKITIFITRLKHSSTTYRFKLLKKSIFLLIRDKASSFQYYLNNYMLFQKPTRWIQIKYDAHANNPLWWRFWCFIKSDETVLLPADKFLFIWDLLMMLVTIANIFYVPLQLSFNLNEDDLGSIFTLFSTIPSCIFLIDLILTFFKGYYDRGILQRNKGKIFWHYIKGDFLLDLAIVLPFILSWMGYSAANYLMLIRMTRVRRTMIVIEEISNFKEKSAIIYQLFCLIYSLLLISHFCACLFHYFALYEVEQGYTHTWLHQQNIFDEDLYTKYFNSLYWITITSMTVGYGDIVPVTTPEKILVTIITFLVTGVFGYALGMIQSIFYKMAEQTNINNSRLRLVSNHIKQRGLNTQLQFRVRKYIEYYLQFKQDEELDLDELMGQLNPKLKQEVQIAMYYRYLKHSKLFGTNFSDDLIKKLCFCIHERTFAPEDVIIRKDELPNQLYIVLAGQVKSLILEKSIKRYQQGNLLCEREFFYQDFMQYNIVASSFVQVAYLNLSEFQSIIQNHRSSFEQYRYAIDNTVFGQNTNLIICEACQSHHQFKNCPLVFFKKNNGKVLAAYHSNHVQNRQTFARKKSKYKQQKNLILNGAYDHIIKMRTQLGVQVDQAFLNKIGYPGYEQQEESDDEEEDKYQSPQARRQSFSQFNEHQHSHSQKTLPQDENYNDFDIDKVEEYEFYYPHDNISKISKIVNKQQLLRRLLDKVSNKKNLFASLVFRQVVQKII